MTGRIQPTKKLTSAIACLILLCNQSVFADVLPAPGSLLPSSVEPGLVGKNLAAPPIEAPSVQAAAPLSAPQPKKSELGPEAAKIKFKLNQIILAGNKIFTDAQLEEIYADKLHKEISVAELEGIVQNITNFYRNQGYILSRAILPPQHVENGIVHIRILEGYISNVAIQGDPKRSVYLLRCFGKQISKSRPLQIDVLERYLRLSNEVPGLSARSVLEPSKTDTGASDMTIVAQQKTWAAFASYDNYGTLYLGPQQITANITGNSIFTPGDSTRLTTVRTARPQMLKYVDLNYNFYLGSQGLNGTVGGNSSQTRPGLNLQTIKISGDAVNLYGALQYPMIRSRNGDLTLDGGFNYIDSGSNTFNHMIYDDHLRPAKFGATYNFADKFLGTNSVSGHIEHGFNILGASNNPNSRKVSRFGADGIYTKLNATGGRLQQLFWRFSTFIYMTGQYSFQPLLATAQFAYGGSQLGRGYDPAEIIGDRGVGGSVELRLDTTPGWSFLQAAQFYGFFDEGAIWNIKNVLGVKKKQSCTSTGLGVRLTLNKYFSGNLMFAQPLTKQVQAEEVVGKGRLPRGFFSIVGSV